MRSKISFPKLFLLSVVGLVILATIAEAVIPAIRGSGLQVDLDATSSIAATKAGLWGKSADGLPYWRKTDGTDVAMSGAGGGGTFATTYSATPANNIVPVDVTGGEVIYRRTDIGTTQLVASSVENNTAATAGNQKFSPLLALMGRGWETTGSTSGIFGWALQAQPVQDTAGRGNLTLYTKVGAGAWTKFFDFVYDPVGTVHKMQANVSIFQMLNSAGSGISPQSNDLYLYTANSPGVELTNGAALSPYTDFARSLGYTAKRWSELRVRHVVGASAAVPSCATSTGAGTGSTCTTVAGSTDIAGTLRVVTAGADQAVNATVATVTFNTAYTAAPRCMIVPSDADTRGLAAAQINAIDQASGSTTTYVTKSGATALANAVTYDWNYNCFE